MECRSLQGNESNRMWRKREKEIQFKELAYVIVGDWEF